MLHLSLYQAYPMQSYAIKQLCNADSGTDLFCQTRLQYNAVFM